MSNSVHSQPASQLCLYAATHLSGHQRKQVGAVRKHANFQPLDQLCTAEQATTVPEALRDSTEAWYGPDFTKYMHSACSTHKVCPQNEILNSHLNAVNPTCSVLSV
jgi:hypothetical protein